MKCKPHCCSYCDCSKPDKKGGRCHYCRNWNHHGCCCRQNPERDDHFNNKFVCFDCRIVWKSVKRERLCEHLGYANYYKSWGSKISEVETMKLFWKSDMQKEYIQKFYAHPNSEYDFYAFVCASGSNEKESKKNCGNCKGKNYYVSGDKSISCRKCGKEGSHIGRDFRAPPQKDKKNWVKCEKLYYLENSDLDAKKTFLFLYVSTFNEGSPHTLGEWWCLQDAKKGHRFEYCKLPCKFDFLSMPYKSIIEQFNTFIVTGFSSSDRWKMLKRYVMIHNIIRFWNKHTREKVERKQCFESILKQFSQKNKREYREWSNLLPIIWKKVDQNEKIISRKA